MELPKRKHPRLKRYDYSIGGYYYVTICTEDNKYIFGNVVRTLAPAGEGMKSNAEILPYINPDVRVILSPIGKIAEEQLFELKKRYQYVTVDKYVIMPTHIHVILILSSKAAGANPRPSLTDIICTYKSITTIICNKNDCAVGRKISDIII